MISNLSSAHAKLQVGVGITILQQFGGANGIVFYASSIFKLAGIERFLNISPYIGVALLGKHNTKTLYHLFIAGFSTEIGTTAMAVAQVLIKIVISKVVLLDVI